MMMMMMVMRAVLGLSCLLLAHCCSPSLASESTGPPSAPQPCVFLQASNPDTHPDQGALFPGNVFGGSGEGQWGSAGSLTVAQGCVLTLWGGQGGYQSFPSGAHVPIEGWNLPLAFHCSCEEEEDRPRPNETAYQKFLRQHLDPKPPRGNDRYCDKIMNERITRVTKTCKVVNTFIHATKGKVKEVCNTKPVKNSNKHTSTQKFRLTKCTLHRGTNRPPCKYRASNSKSFITIACEHNFPVHLDGNGDEN